ncbi:MAG: NAD(P)-binding domain-containing protein [Endozoicomonadaceae bacterium]|nr:NAD(P)-binding domain-containing protein [Endozoicomonadaceae bacterium]
MATDTTAAIIGSGASGLFTAQLLNHLTFVHNLKQCLQPDFHHMLHLDTILNEHLPPIFDKRPGKTSTGQWFDSFLYHHAHKKTCLLPKKDHCRHIDWLLFSNQAAGGSWHTYDINQRTISPYHWMEIPGLPIKKNAIRRYTALTDDREKTDALSLRQYFTQYQAQLPPHRLHFNHEVIEIKHNPPYWMLTVKHHNKISMIRATYLILAIGQTEPTWLNIPGEDLSFVSHTNAQAIQSMKKLKPNSHILVIGTGLSAADTISAAQHYKHHISQIVSHQLLTQQSQYTRSSSSHRLMYIGNLPIEYPHQYHVKTMMLYPEKFKNHYTQYLDYQLVALDKQKIAYLIKENQAIKPIKVDHVAFHLGYQSQRSILPKSIMTDNLNTFDHQTLESTDYPNLFLAGSCTGGWFQRFFLGHAFYIAETIKKREYMKNKA